MSLKRRVALVDKMLEEYDSRRTPREQGEALSTPIPDGSGNHDPRDSGFSEPCSEETPRIDMTSLEAGLIFLALVYRALERGGYS